MEHTKPTTIISDDVQTMLCWLPFNAGTSYKLLDDFTLVFEEEHRLPVLLSGDDLEHYKNTGDISMTTHSVLFGCLSGYGQRIPLVENPERDYAFMAETIHKLAKEGFYNDDLGVFLCSVAQWLRENVNLQTARKALSTAILLEPLHAGLRNDFIATTWQMAEAAEPAVQQNLLDELIDAYQHQFLSEVSQENLEMCSYFFCCALGLLERWQLPEAGEWYASARNTITNERLLQNLDDGEQYGFSMNQCSLMLSQEKAPEDTEITYGAYWYSVAGEETDTVIQRLFDNKNAIPWRFFREKTESDEIEGISVTSTIVYADYPSDSPLRYLCLSKHNDTQKLLNVISMYPYCAEGVANTLEIQSLEKLDEYEGYVRATAPESGASITFFDPLFMMDQMSLCEGYPISINLSAIAMSLDKADLNEFDITSGPLLDLERERLLEENPDADPAEISKVKISMKGTAICIHTRDRPFEAEIRSTAQEVDWFELEGIEYCRILATLIREPDNRPIDYFIYATATALDGYRPQQGDDLQGVVWLQGHLNRSARKLLEDGDGLTSAKDALQGVVANPGLIYGLFDILAESPANPPQLRARCAYTLARLAQKNGLLLSGWNKHLANYRFHDEPVEVDRQFALMLPNLVLSTHDFVRALYTLYSLINGDDEPTRILALRGLVRINSHRDTLHPYRLNTALRDMADGTGSILDRTATMALANLRFWDEESVADLLERAQLFYNGTFYKEALELVELALDREIENEDAWNLKALIMFNGYDNGDKALECLEHVVQAEGTHSGKLHFQGVINYFNGKYADALSYLESVIPDELSIERQFSYHAIMALCLHGLNRVQEAEAYYLKGNELFERCDKSLSYVSYYKRCIDTGLSKCA